MENTAPGPFDPRVGRHGAGLGSAIDRATDHSELSATGAALGVTIPVALYVLSVWVLHLPHLPRRATTLLVAPVTSVIIVAISFGPQPILMAGIIMSMLTAILVVDSSNGAHVELPEDLAAGANGVSS